jgi:hypothetical protein
MDPKPSGDRARPSRRNAGFSLIGSAQCVTRLQVMQGESKNGIRQSHRTALPFVMASAATLLVAFTSTVAAKDLLPAALGGCAAYSGLPGDGDQAGMTFIPAGTFSMGSNRHRPEERYTHIVRVDGFWIDRHEVTNAQFAKFVRATSYRTLAERGGDPKVHANMPKELLAPGSVAFIMPTDVKRGGSVTQWFHYIANADWRHPEGPDSSIEGRENHPVVHVAHEDALAYAHWLGRSGNTPRVAVATVKTTGAAPSTSTANRSPTPGKASSLSSTVRRMATPAPPLSDASSRTAMGSMT